MGKTHVIYLDKNHPPGGLKRVAEDIRASIRGHVNVKKLYMVPEVPADKQNRIKDYPFSENFLCQLYAWGQ